jgi:DNA-binding CsgD family transcriptional regulator
LRPLPEPRHRRRRVCLLGQTYSTAHEHVANIYRKFGINSRSVLMANWLGKQLDRQPSQ